MMKSLKELSGFAIHATDGDIGSVEDFYFEDGSWKIRYVVVDTGHWLPGRQVLLSMVAVGQPEWDKRKLPVSLTRQKVKESPDVNSELPILRQEEIELHRHYLWEPYWMPGFGGLFEGFPGPYPFPVMPADEPAVEPPSADDQQKDPHLRSIDEMLGYDVESNDGAVGHVENFLFDEKDWTIHWLVIDTGTWFAGKRVLFPMSGIKQITLSDQTVYLDLVRDAILNSPAYDPDLPVDAQLEDKMNEHYKAA